MKMSNTWGSSLHMMRYISGDTLIPIGDFQGHNNTHWQKFSKSASLCFLTHEYANT